jgi:TatD DNase family protein
VNAVPLYVDTHVHLDDPQFDGDQNAVIDEALAAGVKTMINISYRPAVWTTTLELAERRPEIRYTLGLHPGHADEGSEAVLNELEQLIVERRPVAIGEIGIDLHWRQENLTTQVLWFERQIELALRHDLPIVVHQRAAAAEVKTVLDTAPMELRALLHSFDGSPALGRLADERGWLLGVGGMMTRRQSENLRDHLKGVEISRFVLETDSPYLVPVGLKSRRNTPAAIPLIASYLAEVTGRPVAEIASGTTSNAESFFRLNTRHAA